MSRALRFFSWVSVIVVPLMAIVVLLAIPGAASAVPTPFWQNTLEDDTAATVNGGTLMGATPTYAAGQVSAPLTTTNKFVSNESGSSWIEWDKDDVAAIFGPTGPNGAWVDANGLTVDLYFSGVDGATQVGRSGLWSVGHRSSDNFLVLDVQDDTIRTVIRNDNSPTMPPNTQPSVSNSFQTGSLGLLPNVTYRLTLRQHSSLSGDGAVELYLDDLGGNAYSKTTPLSLTTSLPTPATSYQWNFPTEVGSGPPLGMTIGNRYPFYGSNTSGGASTPEGTALKNGQAIDEVRIFNGSYSPEQLDAPDVFDYNGNHVVDAADYVLWAQGALAADGNHDNHVNQLDYDIWRAHFGQVVPGSGMGFAEASVPEPASCVIALLWAAAHGVVAGRRRRRGA